MPTALTDEFARLLSTATTPGDFFATGTSPLPLPRLEVVGVGPIALPLLTTQAERLIAVARRAPYGRGAETVVDTDVRRSWQISADQVGIQGRSWGLALQHIVKHATEGLGVTQPVQAELYKLLVYDEGSFFVNHRDTEKSPGMFATLIIALPSVHSGGELVVRHKGRAVQIDMHSADPAEAAFAAFYADCVHEVLPVTSGCRLVLVYNLLRKGRGRKPQPPCYDAEQAQMTTLLQRWSNRKRTPGEGTPEKIVYPLAHAYTPAELSFAALKGADAAAASVLTAAAAQAGCELHAALLSIEESGSAEHTDGPYRHRSWGRDDDDDDDEPEDEFDIGEVFDRSTTLSNWCRPDGGTSALGMLPFGDEELSPQDALVEMQPDEQHFHEATGNEGASFERSYRRAALVLWPQHRRLAVLNQAGLGATLPHLSTLCTQWALSGQDRTAPLWHEAHELAGHMLRSWEKPRHFFDPAAEPGERTKMLALLAQLKDTEHINSFVTEITVAGVYSSGDNPALVHALSYLPATEAVEALTRTVSANAAKNPGACCDLLARSAGAYAKALTAAAQALVEALPGGPAPAPAPEWAWRQTRLTSGFIVALATGLTRVCQLWAHFPTSSAANPHGCWVLLEKSNVVP